MERSNLMVHTRYFAVFFAIFTGMFLSGCATLMPIYSQQFTFAQSVPEVTMKIVPQYRGRVWNITAENNTDEMIKFLIDESSYVTTEGRTERLIRGNTRRIHSDLSQLAIPIPPKAKFQESMIMESDIALTDFQLSYYPVTATNPEAGGKFYFVFEINGQRKTVICDVKFIKEKDEYVLQGMS
jgi:hypothetical protein